MTQIVKILGSIIPSKGCFPNCEKKPIIIQIQKTTTIALGQFATLLYGYNAYLVSN
jgi:hypothetical protein